MNEPAALEKSVSVPVGFLDQITADVTDFNRRVSRQDLAVTIPRLVALTQRGAWEMLQPFLRPNRAQRILEIGSGYGTGLCFLLLQGLDAVGVEPGSSSGFEGRHAAASALLHHNGFDPAQRLLPAFGEALPFPDASFDLVFSIAVLEHVRDPDRVMREALRVCRPGGVVVMNVPDYDSFFEGHYGILWLPYVLRAKSRAAAYVRRVRGLDPYFVHELNFTVPRQFSARAPWALHAGVARVRVFPFLFRPLLYVSALAYFLSLHAYDRHPLLRWFAPPGALRRLHEPARIFAKTLTVMAAALGLAPVFNVVVEKSPAPVAPR